MRNCVNYSFLALDQKTKMALAKQAEISHVERPAYSPTIHRRTLACFVRENGMPFLKPSIVLNKIQCVKAASRRRVAPCATLREITSSTSLISKKNEKNRAQRNFPKNHNGTLALELGNHMYINVTTKINWERHVSYYR